jgi:hypothetical protein
MYLLMKKIINFRILFNFLLIQVLINLVYSPTFKNDIKNDFNINLELINGNLTSTNFSIDSPTFYLIPSYLKIQNFDNYLLFIYLITQLLIYFICVNIDFLGDISSIFLFTGWVVTISWFMGYPDVVSIFLLTYITKRLIQNSVNYDLIIWLTLLVINHYALAIFLLLNFIILSKKGSTFKISAYSLGSFIAGRQIVELYLNNINFNGRNRLRFIFNDGILDSAVKLLSSNLFAVILSGFLGVLVLFFIYSFYDNFENNRKIYFSIIISLIGTGLSLDTSRIFSILVIPVIIVMLSRFNKLVPIENKFKNILYFSICIFSLLIGENHVYGEVYNISPNPTDPSIYNLISKTVNSLMKNIWP